MENLTITGIEQGKVCYLGVKTGVIHKRFEPVHKYPDIFKSRLFPSSSWPLVHSNTAFSVAENEGF